jgi:hypothetical protein
MIGECADPSMKTVLLCTSHKPASVDVPFRLPRDDICPMGNVASFCNRGCAAVNSLSGFRFVPVRALIFP